MPPPATRAEPAAPSAHVDSKGSATEHQLLLWATHHLIGHFHRTVGCTATLQEGEAEQRELGGPVWAGICTQVCTGQR